MAWVRASCIAPRLTIATAPHHGASQVTATCPHSTADSISDATILAAAKKGASWAREMSCTSFRGELSSSPVLLVSPSDSPPGRRAEIIRL
jgi:hypothetical protein